MLLYQSLCLALLPAVLAHINTIANRFTTNTTRRCKPLPQDSTWPTLHDWQTLNNSVSGRLSIPIPPGAACHGASYNTSVCSIIAEQWQNTTFHALDPFSVSYNDETCLPDPIAPCSADGYPRYIISAMNVEDVQAGVNFARKTGVRLVIKGTGHGQSISR